MEQKTPQIGFKHITTKGIPLLFAVLAGAFVLGLLVRNMGTDPEKPETSKEVQMKETFERSKKYQPERMVILSRHNLRKSCSPDLIESLSPHQWTVRSSVPGELSQRGGILETMLGQYFAKYLESIGLYEQIPGKEEAVRFYANSMQRTIATTRYFSTALFPTEEIQVESYPYDGNGDPVFMGRLNHADEATIEQCLSEMNALCEELDLSESFSLLEKVLDFRNSSYAKENGVEHFTMDGAEFLIREGRFPHINGDLPIAMNAADGLLLQYFENPDDLKAAFGNRLTEAEWLKISEVMDAFITLLFTTPTMSKNIAQPMLSVLRDELTEEDRKFTFLCGHDVNLASVLAALDVEKYVLPNTITTQTPIGGKLVFEVWTGSDGRKYTDIYLVYLSSDQMRHPDILTPENPPMRYGLEFSGLERNEDGLFRLDDVLDRFETLCVSK